MENYFNYFTEIEEHFQRRRKSLFLLSVLDWALIETWKDAGIPLEAVLRGIDAAFDRHDKRPARSRKVNSLAYCSQEVLAAAEAMKEALVGAMPRSSEAGLPTGEIVAFLRRNAERLQAAGSSERGGISLQPLAIETAKALGELATGLVEKPGQRLEDLELRLTVLEERLFAVLLASTPEEELVRVRAQADRELAPYRSKMTAPQIEQLLRQYLHKRLLENHGLPRLSLFYL